MSGLATSIGEGLEKLGTGTTRALEESPSGQKVLSLLGNKENELKLTPQGKAVGSMLEDYHRIRTQTLNDYTSSIKAVKDWHQGDVNAKTALPLKTASIDDIHQHAMQTNNPIARTTKKILDQDIDPKTGQSRNGPLTLMDVHVKNQSQARLAGLSGSVGDKMQNVAPLIASMLEHPDPRVQLNGKAVADIVSNELRDTELQKSGNTKSLQSSAKVDMNAAFNIVNKFRKKAGISNQEIPMLKTDPTWMPPSEAEKTATKILHTIQIPFVAIPHIGQYFHIGATAPLESIGKALLSMDKANMMNTIDASGILANTEWDVIHSDLAARTGRVAQWTNSPTAASIISKSIHQPLFNFMRLKQLASSGAVGYHSAIFWAHNFAQTGDKRALAELIEMGIDPRDVIKQGGKLNADQLQKGVYHFTNNRFFFDKSIDRSLWANKNFFHRSMSMYHGFISSETAFIRRELVKQLKAGDVKGLAQYVGTLGVLFPAVAPMIKSLELLARTGSPQQAGAQIKNDYASLTGQNGIVDFGETYLDMIAHIGAMGAAYNYTNAIKGHKLMNAAMGPMLGMAATDTEDLFHAATGDSAKPLGRDITQMIPVAGKPLSHQLFPTSHEEHGDTIPRPHRPRRK